MPSRRLGPLRELIPFVRPYTRVVAGALLALLVAAGATLALPVAVRYMIDGGFSSENAASIDSAFLAIFAVVTVLAFATAARFYLVSWLGERIMADLRSAVYRHILYFSPEFFENTSTGEVLSRLTTDTTVVQSVIGSTASVALRNCLLLFGGLTMLAVTSPRLFSIMLVFIPLTLLPIILFGRRVRGLSRLSQDRIAGTSALAGEMLGAIQTVQAFVREPEETKRFDGAVEEAFRTARRRLRMRALLTATVILLVFGGVLFGLRMGAHGVVSGALSAGQLGQFVLYAVLVAGSTGVLSEVWGELQRAAGAMERILELLRAQPQIQSPLQPVTLPEPARGRVVFDHVTFAYPSRPGAPSLTDFSLTVEPGETVALVGPSGAGKSTVFRLLMRFYDPQQGRILLDDVDIARARLDALRSRQGIVPQQVVIFAASAMDNILFARPEADRAEVAAAAHDAAADGFIRELPEGYDSFLGEQGVRLSGGQQQRIAIARALLKNPPVLLLDEATSALDAQSERLVQQALERAMENRTTIVIAHRLATVLRADRIVVMEHGRVVATGTHAELIRAGGLYAQLAELQFTAGDEEMPAKTRLSP